MSELTHTVAMSNHAQSLDGGPATAPRPIISPSVPPDVHQVDRKVRAKAKHAVAAYLWDLGMRDPDVIASHSERIVVEAIAKLVDAGRPLDQKTLCESVIRKTVRELENWLNVVAKQSGQADECERAGCSIAARLPALLDEFPESMHENHLPEELVTTLRGGVKPVVPEPRHHKMRRQNLVLIPPAVAALFRGWIYGNTE